MTCTPMEARGQFQVVLQELFTLLYDTESLSAVWGSLRRLHWLAINSWPATLFPIPSAGITRGHHHTYAVHGYWESNYGLPTYKMSILSNWPISPIPKAAFKPRILPGSGSHL